MHCDGSSPSRFFLLSKPTTFISPPISSSPNNLSFNSRTRISFPGPASIPGRFGFVRAAGAAVEDGFMRSSQMSFYELLGIPETGTLLEIKQAYKQLARKYHPDVSPPGRVKEYTQRFILVQEAYETLSDPQRRAVYDRRMARSLHLAFSARKMYRYVAVVEDKSEWKNCWQNQLSELKKRSMYKNAGQDTSWGERMRRQRDNNESLDQ